MHKKPSVGDTLFYTPFDLASPFSKAQESGIKPVTVIKVGRKFFTAILEGVPVEHTWMHLEIEISSFCQKTSYGSPGRIYSSVQDYHDETESFKLFDGIAEMFSPHMRARTISLKTISLADLRTIHALACGTATS